MAERWLGSIVSIDCGNVLGVYEGKVSKVDCIDQTISLVNASRNSEKCVVAEITLSAQDIHRLNILHDPESEPSKISTSIGQTAKSAFVQPSSSSSSFRSNSKSDSPVQDETVKKRGESKKKASALKKLEGRKWMSERDEACFSAPVDSSVMDTEFDFEKNLALFDKVRVYDEINALSKSDHGVKLVDCNKRSQAKYRCDENVLVGDVPVMRQISVPCEVEKEYFTDAGLIVPSVTPEYRETLFKKAEEIGLTVERRLEMIGRGASEMVLQLLGGNHRLNPLNSHQRPTVVVLCRPHMQGAQGLTCGRHLSNHNVNVTVLISSKQQTTNTWFEQELKLFSLSGGKTAVSIFSLPNTVDIIIACLDNHDGSTFGDSGWLEQTIQWANQSKAPLLSLDPPPHSSSLEQKWILSPALPFYFPNDKSSVYICDIGLPKDIFPTVDSSYTSPFGSKFIIPLYTKAD